MQSVMHNDQEVLALTSDLIRCYSSKFSALIVLGIERSQIKVTQLKALTRGRADHFSNNFLL